MLLSTTLPVIAFPVIDPIALQIGPIAIRWYALAYIAGLLGAWWYARRLLARPALWPATGAPYSPADVDDFLTWATLGVIIGGRLGYVLFYDPATYLADPLSILYVWQGGMAFHGGLLGVIVAMVLFARSRGASLRSLFDIIAAGAPIGLFFGRLANFVNGELWGRPTDLPWAVVFPIPDHIEGTFPEVGRHPSQLYEAFLEGAVLLVVLGLMARRPGIRRRPGLLTGTFLAGYGISRYLVEFVRQPDPQIGYLLWGTTTMGQLLSLPMIAIGVWLILRARSRPAVTEDPEPQA